MVGTYRLQLSPEFTFRDAEAILPYLHRLGISHLYLSPVSEATPGSTHGYDVTDHNAIREDLGGREGFERLELKAREFGLGIIIDFVPNHAGVGPENAYWQDVLAYGPHSLYASYFDIDWTPLKPELQEKILLPFLGSPYGDVFDRGEIGLTYLDGRFYATYFDHRFALAPATYRYVLGPALEGYERTEPYWDLRDLQRAYADLEPNNRQKAETLRPRLISFMQRIDADAICNAISGKQLHDVLERQHWRLSYWKTAGHEINYRRFFDINGLVGLRMEDDQVFWEAHRLLGEIFLMEGVTGVRIDHVDGLFDPHKYLSALKDLGGKMIWVEKILAPGETLPEAWPVEGTTGYEFLNDVTGLFFDPESRVTLERIYRRFVPRALTFEDTVYRAKRDVMGSTLSSELFRLAYELDRLSEADYHTRDFTLEGLREALAEVVASVDRYRTYLPHDPEEAQLVIQRAVHLARQRNPATEPTVYEFIERVILGEVREDLKKPARAWVGRFQQYTAPVAAKGVEDTAFYRYFLLPALNEVGGEPDEFGRSLHAFHSRQRFRALRYPYSLLPSSTHDHKRGEETRLRMAAISELPDEWEEVAAHLAQLAEPFRTENVPARSEQYLFFQTLVSLWHGANPESLADRLWEYSLKAARERKLRTSWIHQNESYEKALEAFIRNLTADPSVAEVAGPFAEKLARYGFHNAISETIIKCTSPGVPDTYQGAELADLSLVDPDNRRPVDYDVRARILDELDSGARLADWLDAYDDRAKLGIISRLLRLRSEKHDTFFGSYLPIDAEGRDADQYVAYARLSEESDDAVIVIVPRFSGRWQTPPEASFALNEDRLRGTYRDLLSEQEVRLDASVEAATLPLRWAVLVRV